MTIKAAVDGAVYDLTMLASDMRCTATEALGGNPINLQDVLAEVDERISTIRNVLQDAAGTPDMTEEMP